MENNEFKELEELREENKILKAYNQVYQNEIERYKAEIKELENKVLNLRIELKTIEVHKEMDLKKSHK